MPVKKAAKKKTKARGGKKKSVINVDKIQRQLRSIQAKAEDLPLPEDGITDDDVHTVKGIAEELQEINRGLKEALKNAMMADGKIKPGQTITAGGRRVFLKARPGCKPGSMDPEDYDLESEPIS